jgi:hypothetical protein
MWNDTPNGSGNWLTWASLASGDVLCANGKTAINVNVSITVSKISTAAETGANGTGSPGGGFNADGGKTITADIVAGTSTCLTILSGSGTLNIVGNITGGTGSAAIGIIQAYTNVALNVTGNIAAGLGSNCWGFYKHGAAAVVNGNILAGSNHSNSYGVLCQDYGTLTVTGNVTGGENNGCYGIYLNSGSNTATVNNGIITGGGSLSGGAAIAVINTGSAILNNCSLINRNAPAVIGPFIYNPAATNYIQYPGPSSTTVKLGVEPAIGDIRYGTAIGSNVGICNIPPAADVLDTAAVDAGTGTYHEAPATSVQVGVNFGPGSSYLGTFAAGGAPLIGEGLVD